MSNRSKKQKEDLSKIEKAVTTGTGKKQRYTATSKPVLTALAEKTAELENLIKSIEHPEDKKFVTLHVTAILNRVALRFANEQKKEEIEKIRAKPLKDYLPKKENSSEITEPEINPEGSNAEEY